MSNRQPISTFLGIAAGLVLATTASADIINVGPGDSIQAAIDAAVDGDEIVVAPGTYLQTINFNGKAVWLRSSDGADVTIIDAPGGPFAGSVVTCDSGEGPDTVLEGFTLTSGKGTVIELSPFCGFGETRAGGGMFVVSSSPTVVACLFSANDVVGVCVTPAGSGGTGVGGGMYNDGGSPIVTDCTFSGNTGAASGGVVAGS